MFVNPWGLWWQELTASDICVVDEQARVVEEGAHLGIALDGDADRLIIVDEKGRIVDGDQLMALIALDPAVRPRSAFEVMQRLGAQLLDLPVVAEALAKDGIDPATIEASMNSFEFGLRENNTGSFPRGMGKLLILFTSSTRPVNRSFTMLGLCRRVSTFLPS